MLDRDDLSDFGKADVQETMRASRARVPIAVLTETGGPRTRSGLSLSTEGIPTAATVIDELGVSASGGMI